MTDARDVDRPLESFVSGRLPFPDLVLALRASRSGGIDDALVRERLQHWVDLGRLPPDLKALLLTEMERGAANGAAGAPTSGERDAIREPAPVSPVAEDHLDQPTIPLQQHRARAEGALPDLAPVPAADPLKAKVDEVVIDALVNQFTGLRGALRRGAAERDDRGLDASLADFRSLRYRRDAVNAEAGRARSFALPKQRTAAVVGPGAMLKDRFVLDHEIGRGGMGVVYRAVDRRRLEAMHRQPYVAVKVLGADLLHRPEALRALEAEARKAQDLAHPNIVAVHDFERDGGTVFIVMELLEGRSLEKLLDEEGEAGLPGPTADRILRGLCAGLGHAHEQGVAHLDLKPANVFVRNDGEAKVLDFGIANATRGEDRAAGAGGFTPAYAAPEQIDGAAPDPRQDLYGLGCIAFMLHAGAHPFGKRPAVEARAQALAPARPAALADSRWAVLRAALAFDPAARPGDAAAFGKAFFAAT